MIFFREKRVKRVVANCGHTTNLIGTMVVIRNGEEEEIVIEVFSLKPKLCTKCFKKIKILCAVCGDTIKIGDPAGLTTDKKIISGFFDPDSKGGECIACKKCTVPIGVLSIKGDKPFTVQSLRITKFSDIPKDPRFKWSLGKDIVS